MTLELAPAIGEFVAHRQPLFRVHGSGPVDGDLVWRAVAVSEERTIERHPAFAIRIIVDTSIRALSPAVNDPTTGAQAIDVLEVLVRELASRNLEWLDETARRAHPAGSPEQEVVGRADRTGLGMARSR